MTGCSRRHSGVFAVPHSCFGAVVNALLCFKINPLSAALSLPLFVLSIASVSGLSGSTWKSPGLHTSAEMWGWNMLCVHIVTSLGPKGIPAMDYKLSTCKALMNLWSALARWTLRVFPFVDDCLSFSFSLSFFISVGVFWPLTPHHFWHCWLPEQDEWHCLSLSVQPCEPRVGGSKWSIKCFCWGREKIWYGGETKVIYTRKFNCLSLSGKFELEFGFPTKSISCESSSDKVTHWDSLAASLLFALSECLHRFDASVYLCLYKRAFTQTPDLPKSLSATMEGSCLLFLTNAMRYYRRRK